MKAHHHPVQGALWMLFAGAAFALVNTVNQYMGFKLGLASTNIAFYQYSLAFVLLMPWWLLRQNINELKTRKFIHHLIRVGLAVAGIQFWTWALSKGVPIWQAIALVMTSPVFATLGSRWFLKERVSIARWLATLAGFCGGMLILAPWTDDFTYLSLLPVVAAVFWAGYSLMVKDISHHEDPHTIVFYLFLLMVPFNFMVGFQALVIPEKSLWWFLLASGGLTALAQQAIALAYSKADASFVQPFDHAKLPLNVLAGWLVFAWVPPGRLWLGAAIIIGSSYWLAHHEHRTHSKIK